MAGNTGNKRVKGDGKGRQGGRQKGTPNKATTELRKRLTMFVEGRWDDFMTAYDQIADPEKKCSIMLGLLNFIAPKMASVEYKGETPVKTLSDELDELSGEKTRK